MVCKDAVGQALLDYLKGERNEILEVKSSISEDDEIPLDYLFREYIDIPLLEKKALDLCYGKVLDVGAAAGAHSMVLFKKGLNVTSIDISPGAIEIMKLRGVPKPICCDFFDFQEGKFDTILALMNGLGIAGSLDKLPVFLRRAKLLLNEGGQLLVDSSDIQYMFEEEDGSMWVDLNSNYCGEVQYQMKYKECETDWFDWLFIDFERLQLIASSHGWKCELIAQGKHYDYLAKLTIA